MIGTGVNLFWVSGDQLRQPIVEASLPSEGLGIAAQPDVGSAECDVTRNRDGDCAPTPRLSQDTCTALVTPCRPLSSRVQAAAEE